jgi:hypothetical protein
MSSAWRDAGRAHAEFLATESSEQAAAPEQNAEEHEMLKKEEKPARRRSAFGAQPRAAWRRRWCYRRRIFRPHEMIATAFPSVASIVESFCPERTSLSLPGGC